MYIFFIWCFFTVTKPNKAAVKLSLTHNSPKYLERNSALEKLEGFFPLKYGILSFGKCLNN